jgi:hypothetical protein
MDDLPDCPHCLRLLVEDLAKGAADPKNLAKLDPEEAQEMRQYLGRLLSRPDDSLQQLVRALASKAKAAVGAFEQ